MTEQQNRGKDFEERLLSRLKAVVAERGAAEASSATAPPSSTGPRRHRPLRLALAGAAALAVAAVVLIVSSGGGSTSKAFAVEPQAGGGVTIRVYSLEDPAGLERALRRAGIPAQVNWLPAGTTCRERHLEPSTVKTSMGGRMGGFEMGGRGPAMTIGVMSPRQYRERWREYRRGDLSEQEAREAIPNVSLDPKSFGPDQSVVISGSPDPYAGDPEGGFRAQFQVVEGQVEPCERIPAAAHSIGSIRLPQGTAADTFTEPAPQPGQFLYAKTRVVQLQGWEPGGRGTGTRAEPRHFTTNLLGPEGDALPAFVSTTKEVWTAPDGRTRVRETLDGVEFLSGTDQRRWEAAGSPPPFAYDPGEHDVRRDASGRLTKEFASRNWRGRNAFANAPKLARLPTDPEALRRAIEASPQGTPPYPANSEQGSATGETLLEIATEPIAGKALSAAAFKALAEMPGIELEPGVADAAHRHGQAVTWNRGGGFGRRLIFDPERSRLLAEAEMVLGPPATGEYGVPPGTPFDETVYLESRIVGPGDR
ncbi:MAG TPA: hypothetical protein VHA54_10415 [Solirubrobacterales bacterium]|nr:hypothetical protein [Solirubrobacterales bacterium]